MKALLNNNIPLQYVLCVLLYDDENDTFFWIVYNNLFAGSEDTRGTKESIFGKMRTIQYLNKFPLMGISFSILYT